MRFAVVLLCGALNAWGLSPEKIREIDRAVSTEMSRQSMPGVSIAIGSDMAPIWSAGYGMSDLENFVPAKAYTLYRTASIAKPMTATAIMQLAEKGKIDIDAPIQTYLPDFPKKQWPITTRQLMGHLGGIRHYRDDQEAANPRFYATLKDAMKIFESDELVAEPGTKYNYTTYGFVLLGRIVEAVSGMDYVEYMKANVFAPAGMATMHVDSTYRLIPNRTRGYWRTPTGVVENAALLDTSSKIPGGGLLCAPEDLVRFALALGGGKLVSDVTRRQMFSSQLTKDGKPTAYGFGWGVTQVAGRPAVDHGGGQSGTATRLTYFPDQRVAIAIMTNLQGADLRNLNETIAKIVLDSN